MNQTNYQIINSNNEIRWFNGSPLVICCANLYQDNESNKLLANLRFMNIQPEKLKSVTVDIICYNIIKNEIARVENYTFENLNLERNKSFGDTSFITIENTETMSVDVLLKSAVDSDGEEWTNENSQMFDTPIKQNSISSYMGRYFGKFRDLWLKEGLADDKLLYAPHIENGYWLCVCGAFNWSVEDTCCKCGAKLNWLAENTDVSAMNRDEDFLKRKNEKLEYTTNEVIENTPEQQEALYKDKKEHIKSKKEKKPKLVKKKRTITAFTVVLVILAAITFGVYYFLIPASNYYNATALISEGKYDQAIDELSKLNGYGDSEQEILRAKYLKAENLLNSGKYLEASNIFDQIDYSDSQEKYSESMYKYGELLYAQEDYISSLKIFTDLSYEDSSNQAEKAEKAAMDNASKLLESKEYSEASELFLEIYQITKDDDALEQANSASLSQANYLYETNKYVEALRIYESLSGYYHVDVTLKKLYSLENILSTSIHLGEKSSVWENTTMQCTMCHTASLTYQFFFSDNGTYEFYRYCSIHNAEDDYEIIKGQYKIEDDVIYTLQHNGGSTEWEKLAVIENISLDDSISSKNAKLVVTNPFDKKHSSISLYGNIVGENSSPI